MTPHSRAIAVVALWLVACGPPGPSRESWSPDADEHGFTKPTAATVAANAAVRERLPLDESGAFENARRERVAGDEDVTIPGPGDGDTWNTAEYDFVAGEPPDSVNPSLWRQARLNNEHGLFRVADGIHQVRGYDLSNLTLIEGKTGWIVVDPLTAQESAAAGFALAQRTLGERPVRAVIFTHSHVDHFGGVAGIVTPEEAAGVRIVAPQGFVEEATSENVLAGIAMTRRADFMFGRNLPRSPRGHVDSGLGKGPAYGTVGILAPTDIVDHTGQELVLDGVRFVFQHTPESEAPAELTFYLPDAKAFCGAEVVTHTMHNLYTLRGAKVRDALRWSGYIDEMIQIFGDAEVFFASHHWPIWGNAEIVAFLKRQRDTYKYIHDQTLRLANNGHTPREIAEQLDLPSGLAPSFPNRGYYGTVRHNSKAVYQWYFGWYDGNPAHLDPLPPTESAAHYVEFMGGAEAVLEKARASYEAGEYRWVATVLDHLVYAQPGNTEAAELLARAYDQLGYQAESGPWRDVYLNGAFELRHGTPKSSFDLASAAGLLRHTPLERFLDALAVRLNGPEADGTELTLNLVLTDTGETHVLWIENAVLHHHRRDPDPEADVTLRVTEELLLRMFTGGAGAREIVFSDDLDVDGSRTSLFTFLTLLDVPDGSFEIVRP